MSFKKAKRAATIVWLQVHEQYHRLILKMAHIPQQ